MNLPTMTMDRTVAREKFLEYRKAVRDRHDSEDAEIMRGYRFLSKGVGLIDIAQALRMGGVDDNNRPNIAIARADWTECQVRVSRDGDVVFTHDGMIYRRTSNQVRLPEGTLPWIMGETYSRNGRTMVPPVPPGLRPSAHLRNYHLLWEVDDWSAIPPRDPALLKRVGGNLFAVLAVWDLTELERAVLSGRS